MSKEYLGYSPFRDRHGKLRHRVRLNGCRGELPGGPKDLGKRKFDDLYFAMRSAMMTGMVIPKVVAAPAPSTGSLLKVVDDYLASDFFLEKAKAANTRTNVGNRLHAWCRTNGQKPFSEITKEVIEQGLANRKDHAKSANNWLSDVRGLMKYGVKEKLIKADPTIGVEKLAIEKQDGDEGFHSWSEDEWSQFIAYWPEGSKPWLAAMVLMYTCQRVSDACRMGYNMPRYDGSRWKQDLRPMVEKGRLRFPQEKTGTVMDIPMMDELKRALAVCNVLPHVPPQAWITDDDGKPMDAGQLSRWFSKKCTKAGLPHCTAHGIRKLSAQRVYIRTGRINVVMSFTGHLTEQACRVYLKDVDKAALSDQIAM